MASRNLDTPSAPAAIRRWVDIQPDAPALVHGGGTVSYAELWSAARGWAGALRPLLTGTAGTGARPTGPSDPGPAPVVGVLADRGPLVPTGQLAAWLAGAGYLPLDPAVPPGRLASVIARADCRVVITTDALRTLLPPGVTALTAPADPVGSVDPVDLVPADAAGLAYVIYTSGSTGEPKGVEVGHHSLALLLRWYRDFFQLGPGGRTSMLCNLGFDGLVVDVWGALYAGAAVAIPEQSVVTSPERIAGFLADYGVTHTNMPTPMLERFLGAGQRPGRVRTVETGGDLLRTWPGPDFPAPVFNTYGPTEGTVQVTAGGDLRTVVDRERLPTLGRPLPDAEVYLVGPDGSVVTTPGDEGEVVIGGPMLALGYRGDAELTARVFRADGPGGGRVYHTGDICRWTEDGELEFLGRRDQQIKIRGYRVELGEIEQRILRYPGVRMVAVVPAGDGRLAAWAEGDGDPAAILADLGTVLPDYMVPERLVFVSGLPVTSNGKVDRRKLAVTTATATTAG
ncbi:amino acid adenylation domain-containing protein [Micromonospora sp. CPCC 206060]|uniref:amino acid adenylation domain-containing protein n=1 Tax=Micromonospora sp. CPCC 206060 TaxID=3122406 RepID=UPI002FF3E8FA